MMARQGVAVALAVLAAAVLPAQAVVTVTSGPDCAAFPATLRAALALMPVPQADQLCNWLLNGITSTCNLAAPIEMGLVATTATLSACNVSNQVEPVGSLSPLQDTRPLPGAFSNVSAIYAAEGATFYWLYRVLRNLDAYLPCASAGQAWAPPAGWRLAAMLNLTESGGASLPFAAVLHQPLANQVVVAIRGTMTAY